MSLRSFVLVGEARPSLLEVVATNAP